MIPIEYISKSEKICNIVGSNFKSSLYENFFTKHKPRHLEYFPMFNGKIYSLSYGVQSTFRNNEFRRQYNAFLLDNVEKDHLLPHNILFYCYFLLLQDRVSETISMFTQLEVEQLSEDGSLVLQYNYMHAYLDFYTGKSTNYQIAREVVNRYKDYPILSWRVLFQKLSTQLEEHD